MAKVSSEVIPLPHQLHALNRALSGPNIRYILADEVGLGKTIEAGLIIKELKARGLIRRILVVCPRLLVTQWRAEMQDKFGETFRVILPEDYEAIRNITDNQDIYGQFDQVISPMDAIKPLEKRTGWTQERIDQHNQQRVHAVVDSGWDLIIIDEAHRVAGSTGEVARHKLGKMLASASPYLLLLTATPHNGKTEPFLRLVRLVDEKAFPYAAAVVKEQVAPYVIRSEKREAIDNQGNKLFKNRNTQAITLSWGPQHSMQRAVPEGNRLCVQKLQQSPAKPWQEHVGDFPADYHAALGNQQHQGHQGKPVKTCGCAEAGRFFHGYPQPDRSAGNGTGGRDGPGHGLYFPGHQGRDCGAGKHDIFSTAGRVSIPGCKVESLRMLLEDITARKKPKNHHLYGVCGDAKFSGRIVDQLGYKVSILNGSMDIRERNEVLADFRKESQVLISTDARRGLEPAVCFLRD